MKVLKLLYCCLAMLLIPFHGITSALFASLNAGSCGQKNISIFYEIETDYFIACDGISRARSFFTRYGYSTDTPISLHFSRRVTVHDPILGHKQIYGYFNPKTMSVFMTSLSAPFVKDSEKVSFGIAFQPGVMLEEYHRSVVAHELGHLFAQHNFNLRTGAGLGKPEMEHSVQEYIAYVVQLSTMEPTLLDRILRQYVPEIIFDDEQQITALLFACNPEKFAIMSYRHFHSLNVVKQKNLLDRIFSYALHPDLASESGL